MPDDPDTRPGERGAQAPSHAPPEPTLIASSLPPARLSSQPAAASSSTPPEAIGARHDPIRVLVVDDERDVRRAALRLLSKPDFIGVEAEDGESALELIRAGDIDVVLADVLMPRLSGMELLQRVREGQYPVEVIVMTALNELPLILDPVKAGAFHFLKKPFSMQELRIHVVRAAERKRMIERTRSLEAALGGSRRLNLAIGGSPAMQEVADFVFRVAGLGMPVLILGESGTGKELIAQEIHAHSARARKPYVPVNCGALPNNLAEGLLFGSRRGAFTGAEDRRGYFEAAHGGTIFLDELGELPLELQPKLLRVVGERKVQRLGETDEKPIDVRVIAATNVDIEQAVAERRFRQDLYFRLNVHTIRLPPLRERKEDIGELAYHFLRRISTQEKKTVVRIAPVALRALEAYEWPGNVRELENVIARGHSTTTTDTIELSCLPPKIRSAGLGRVSAPAPEPVWSGAAPAPVAPHPAKPPSAPPKPEVLDYNLAKKEWLRRFEREYFERLLKAAEGNISKAARLAGLDRSNFKRVFRRATQPGGADDDEG